MRWRLRNFKVKLKKQGKELKAEDYITDHGILNITDSDIQHEISIDYDYQRRISQKYPEKKLAGTGKILFPANHIKKATLHCQFDENVIECDITKHYSEYVDVNDSIMPDELLWKALKLWEFETKEFPKIDVVLVEGSKSKIFTHQKIQFYPEK